MSPADRRARAERWARARRIREGNRNADAWTESIGMRIPSGWWADIEAEAEAKHTEEDEQ